MTLKTGDKLPDATLRIMTGEGISAVDTDTVFAGKKVVLFGLPGAFTPTCHFSHLPGYVKHAKAIKAKGVDVIACISVNDIFVMNAWEEQVSPDGEILMLADGDAAFTIACGLDFDSGDAGMGIRSTRYSMIVDDGVVTALNTGDERGKADISGAEAILKAL